MNGSVLYFFGKGAVMLQKGWKQDLWRACKKEIYKRILDEYPSPVTIDPHDLLDTMPASLPILKELHEARQKDSLAWETKRKNLAAIVIEGVIRLHEEGFIGYGSMDLGWTVHRVSLTPKGLHETKSLWQIWMDAARDEWPQKVNLVLWLALVAALAQLWNAIGKPLWTWAISLIH